MRLLFARHGESDANVRHLIANRGSTHALTTNGKRQARALAEAATGERVSRIVSSPIRRAVETAEIVGGRLGVPVEPDEALREFDCGIFEGRSDADAWAAHAGILAQWLEHGRMDVRLEGGESLVDLRDRFVPFIERLVAAAGDRDETLLLISHRGLYLCLLPDVLIGIDPTVARARGLDHVRYVVAVCGPGGLLTCVDWPG